MTPERRERNQAAWFNGFTALACFALTGVLYANGWGIAGTITGIATLYYAFGTAGILMLADDEIPREHEPWQFLEHTGTEFAIIGALALATLACVALVLVAPWSVLAALGAAWAVVFAFATVAAATIYEDD